MFSFIVVSAFPGRILNRFSKDIGQLDEILPLTMYDFLAVSTWGGGGGGEGEGG